jgi:hypothetical protein
MRLYDLARVIRIKNAGPFTLTLDIFFADAAVYKKVLDSPDFTSENIAKLYKIPPEKVQIHPFKEILAIKVSLPRLVSSGNVGDRDVYGAQQHFPLADIEIS